MSVESKPVESNDLRVESKISGKESKMKWNKFLLLGAAGLAVVLVVVANSRAGGKVTVGQSWPANQRVSMDQIDHRPLDSLLQKYVDKRGMVNYTAWRANAADTASLDRYLAHLSQASLKVQASREGIFAYWINAYNAVTLKGILREYPTTSIRNHTAKVVEYNIWKDLLLVVGDQKVSLEDIEHKVLRKMNEPRIHFAIVCASIGCPKLSNRAFFPQSLDAQLTQNTRDFFADPTKFRSDSGAGQIQVSPILKWFAEDFGANTSEMLKRIAPYLPDQAAQQLAASGRASVGYLDYDWGLNDRKGPVGSGQKAGGSGRKPAGSGTRPTAGGSGIR